MEFRKQAILKYKKIISIPSIDKAFFSGHNVITITTSQIDLINKKTKNFIIHKVIGNDGTVYNSPFNLESISSNSLISPSKSKWIQVKEVIASINNEPDTTSTYSFDLYNQNGLVSSILVKDLHRGIFYDEWFGRPVWSKCERYIAYVADAKSNSAGFYDKDQKDNIVGEKYTFNEDWGETFVGVKSPSLYILDLQQEKVIPIEPFPSKSISAGQATWSPEGGLVFVGWDVTVRKLGIRSCYNRISSLYYFDLMDYLSQRDQLQSSSPTVVDKPKLKLVNLLPDVKFSYFRSPRFTLDGKEMVFLGFDKRTFTHNSCAKLFKLKWNDGKVIENSRYQVVVDEMNFKDEFKGIYCGLLPSNPWISQDTLLFSTNVKSVQCIISVNIKNSKVTILNDHTNITSMQLLDIDRSTNQILLGLSTPDKPTTVILLNYIDGFNSNNTIDSSKFKIIHSPIDSPVDFKTSLLDIPICDGDSPTISRFQVIYLKQNGDEKRPLILYPHGGPHSAFTTLYSFPLVFLMSQGYNIALVNYRGSTGFGQDFLQCLPGKIGRIDLKDCSDTIDYILKMDGLVLDTNKIIVLGGSHGGYLAAHLSIDNRIKACVLRNPVIDIAMSITQSDIPDCVYNKSGILPRSDNSAYYSVIPTMQDLELMRKLSPITIVHLVKIPTFILLGNSDLRVPFSQGLLYYRALKENKLSDVQCNMYPKAGHSLETIEAKLDQWIQTVCWLEKHLPRGSE